MAFTKRTYSGPLGKSHKLKIEAKWFLSYGIFKNKDSEYQVEAELHLNQTLKRRLEPPKTKPPDPSPPWSHVDEGTSTTVGFLTMSGWVMSAQQTRERSSRWSHHTHCAGTNLPRRGISQHLHGSKLLMKTVTARGNEAFTAGSLRRGCGMGARSVYPSKQSPSLLRGHQPPPNFPRPRVREPEVKTGQITDEELGNVGGGSV